MASAVSHAMIAVTAGWACQCVNLGRREWLLGAFCSLAPDLDVVGFHAGIAYGDVWGHRGISHSLAFAALFSGMLVAWCYRRKPPATRAVLMLYFFFCMASHGVLDAMTNGGLGVAFFSPFDTTRYFFPFRPVLVSPIGVGEFLSGYGLHVLVSEAIWIWMPACAVVLVMRLAYRIWPAGKLADS